MRAPRSKFKTPSDVAPGGPKVARVDDLQHLTIIAVGLARHSFNVSQSAVEGPDAPIYDSTALMELNRTRRRNKRFSRSP